MLKFFATLSRDYNPNYLNDRVKAERISLFNSDEDDFSEEGFIKIRPETDGRIEIQDQEKYLVDQND